MKKLLRVLTVAVTLLAAIQNQAFADDCSTFTREINSSTKNATASTLANLRQAKGSVSYETKQMFDSADSWRKGLVPPTDLCPTGCHLNEEPLMVLRATPNKYLTGYDDEARCNQLLVQTTKSPFSYADRKFSDLTAFENWYNQLSTGKGKDGSDLYQRCDGLCSPRYTTTFKRENGGVFATADVVCGPARDKNDDSYELVFGFRWYCEKDK